LRCGVRSSGVVSGRQHVLRQRLGGQHVHLLRRRRRSVLHILSDLTRVARWYIFKPKNPHLGNFWRVLQWEMVVYFMNIWSILQSFVILYGHLVYFVKIWYILW
jgi:hypothetical protein